MSNLILKNARILGLILLSALPLTALADTVANSKIPSELKDVGITEKLGEQVAVSELEFRNEAGETVKLADYFKRGKPVVLSLIYFECPNICNFLLNGMVDTLKQLDWTPGNQFEIVSVSIDARETPELASRKKANYIKSYNRPEAAQGWHFLTGDEKQVRELARQVGFGYKWDEKEQQFAHGSALFVLTPEGRLSRLLYGIEFKPKDFRLALLEASDGRIGTVIDRILLFCYRYNPTTRQYSLYAMNLMTAGGYGTVAIFGGYLVVFWRRQRRPISKDNKGV